MDNNLERLRSIKSFPQLVTYLRDELDWPIESDDVEDLSFDYQAEELGLDAKTAVKIKEIKQLRPFVSGQPWGIFFVEFENKKLPVVVLRSILSHLVVKKRASANKSDAKRWQPDDLLFISAFGDENTDQREIAFAHFHQEAGDLPTLRVLGWDGADTPLKLEYVGAALRDKLHWPLDENDLEAWRRQWSSPFRHRVGHVIRTADMLAQVLAGLARRIRDAATTLLAAETEKGLLTKLYKAFQTALIHDLKPEDFADTYAQTITYGLLTAAISRTDMSGELGTALIAENVTDMVPITNPFLREMLQEFLKVGGRKGGIDFDLLGVQDVVELLRGPETDLPAILRDFGNRTRGEDPVIHFYEHFLSAYNKKLKIQRGVFYTPQPVVSYIVRSVHELLQTEFGLEDGLADTTTWGEMVKRLVPPAIAGGSAELTLKIPEGVSPDTPFVQVLDPATGTATFLVEVIDVVYRHLKAKWEVGGLKAMPVLPPTSFPRRATSFGEYWNQYVALSLLRRLHGYELMMAPYAIAHMKIGLKLAETGYRFGTEERARIYLTNALEPWVKQLPLIGFDALAHEAAAVNEIKRHKHFTVVIGNPPYAGISANMTEQAQRIVDAYRVVDGAALKEKKVWLQDDYVKFIRSAQVTIDNAGVGVFGYITNHGYLDNPTFRGMRQSLMQTFSHLCVIDLHGNANKKEQSPDGSEDKNVFDIRQGVAVCLATHGTAATAVEHAELWGSRKEKYSWLAKHSVVDSEFRVLTPESPYYFLEPQSWENDPTYEAATPVDQIFSLANSGIVTARDGLVLDLDLPVLRERIVDFRNPRFSDLEIQTRFDLSENYMWRVSDARKQLMAVKDCEPFYSEMLYRPFNTRHIFFHPSVVWRPRMDVMRHMRKDNLALITTRQTRDPFGALATRLIVGHKSVAAYDINSVFPLYTYPVSREQRDLHSSNERVPNLAPVFLKKVATALGISQKGSHGLPAGLTPEDIFHYAYAVFHSPGYRSRYAEFLKIDFPRLPLTSILELFHALARLGGELTALHLLESPKLDQPITEFIGGARKGNGPEIEKISWSNDTVWVDKAQTTGFRGVREDVWNFHIGGYQVCQKWLKDRKGRTLTKVDIAHYHKIVVALSETIRLMAEIDQVIEAHGGWPLVGSQDASRSARITAPNERERANDPESSDDEPAGEISALPDSLPFE